MSPGSPTTKSTFAPSTFKKVLNHSTKNRDGVEKFLCHQDVNVMQFAKNYCQIIVRNLFWKNNAHMLVYVVICTRLGSPASWAMFFFFSRQEVCCINFVTFYLHMVNKILNIC